MIFGVLFRKEGIWKNVFVFENVDILVVDGFSNWCKVPQASKGLIYVLVEECIF